MTRKIFFSRKHISTAAAIAGMVLILSEIIMPNTSKAEKESNHTSHKEITNKSIAHIIRRLIDLPQEVAAGGSRGKIEDQSLCLMTPTIEKNQNIMAAYAITSKPSIVTNLPLNEITIKNTNGKILKKYQASSKKHVLTPISWPLNPIKEDEDFILEIRGINTSAGEKIIITLTGIDNEIKYKNETTQAKFNSAITTTKERLEMLKASDPELALQMLFNSKDEKLNALKSELKNLCGNQ